ncbi:DUF3558 family protein [Herbihabitans rhizosphaerae]|nr:DUF3558 family protein [Herbihabitans rhizosphaerae]
MKRILLAASTFALLGAAVACSENATGTPSASGGGSTTATEMPPPPPLPTGGGTAPTTTDSEGSSGPLAGKSPCALLSPAELTQIGISAAGKESKQGIVRQCRWSQGDSQALGIVDTAGLANITGATEKAPVPTVGRHQAVRWTAGTGNTCSVSLELTSTARVDAQVVATDASSACPKAMKLAQLVEPKLP